ncbi:hypothetical protein ACFL1P_01500 [Patescibacteria group bacterium]
MKEMKAKNFFLLSWKKLWILVISGFASIVLHNLISGLTGVEEAFFFIIVIFVIPTYFLIAILFTLINLLRKKSK